MNSAIECKQWLETWAKLHQGHFLNVGFFWPKMVDWVDYWDRPYVER